MWYLLINKKKNPLFVEDGIEKSVPHDHYLSSLGKLLDDNMLSSGRIFLFHSHTHDEFIWSSMSALLVANGLEYSGNSRAENGIPA